MKFIRLSLIAIVLVSVLAVALVPASGVSAQTTRTKSLTETQINQSYRITNPLIRTVSNRVVDLQPGQAVISATLTFRNGTVANTVAVYTPYISNGRIYWTLVSATVNGQAASSGMISQINSSLGTSWRNYIRQYFGTGKVSAVEVTADAINVTYVTAR